MCMYIHLDAPPLTEKYVISRLWSQLHPWVGKQSNLFLEKHMMIVI